jgi:type VI secretion system protein ImpH
MAETTGSTAPRPIRLTATGTGEVAGTVLTEAQSAVLDYLVKEGPRVSFFQALLLLERALPQLPRIGVDGPPPREPVRIRPSLSLACPPSDLESIEPIAQGLRITTTFLGLYGVDTPLPYSYAEHIAGISDDRGGERVRGFLDIFHHRLFSLLYRAWKKSRPVAVTPGSVDPLHDRVLSLIGHSEALGLGGARRPRLREARLRVLRARTAAGLQTLLRQRINPPCTVEQLEPRWVNVPLPQRSRLGGQNSVLGQSLLCGSRIPDRNKICVKLPARRFGEFEQLLPEGDSRQELDEAVASYLRDPLDYVLDVTLPAEEVPPWSVGKRGALGRTAWLGAPKPEARVRWQGWRRQKQASPAP